MVRFDCDTQVEELGKGRFAAKMDTGWWVMAGPNGGYVAAVMLRAMEATVGEPERHPRSLTLHYTSRPAEGEVEIQTQIERTGRSLTTVTARMLQGGKLLAVAVGAFSKPRKSQERQLATAPEVIPFEQAGPLPIRRDGQPLPIHQRYDIRWALEERPWAESARARSGAWMRLSEPRAIDAAVVAALSDALPPAVFSISKLGEFFGGVPTIDLSIHFRAELPLAGAKSDDYVLVLFETRCIRDGFLEEDGEIYSRDGTLLAQSRQLAILA